MISMETSIVLEDITPPDSASSQFTSGSARSLKGNLSIEHIRLVAYRSDTYMVEQVRSSPFYFMSQGSFFDGKLQRLVTL